MLHWRSTLSANSKSIADVTIKYGIYQGLVTPAVLYRAQLIERFAGQDCHWIQV